MAYTKAQAKKLAEQIHSRFGARIAAATAGTAIPPEFVAGLIGVEAGRDRQGQIRENSTRFEPHVFRALRDVRDGARKSYSNITRKQIGDAGDEALKALATSYSLTQIMGWWTVHLGGTVADLRDPAKHLDYTIKLLLLNSKGDFERGEYAGEFRQWNTGRETGKTFHADYVANATAVMDAYRELGRVEPEPLAASLIKDTEKEEPPAPLESNPEPPKVATPPPRPPVENIPAIPPLPVNVPDWAKRLVKWLAGLNLGSLAASFAVLRDNPAALMAVLNIIKWGFIALGVVVGVIAIGVFAASMWNKKLANDLNMARLRNYADPDTKNVDFKGWKTAPDKSEVKL